MRVSEDHRRKDNELPLVIAHSWSSVVSSRLDDREVAGAAPEGERGGY